jgi:hypothetical protein
MPLSFDPAATAEFWLAGDADKPAQQRPVFLVRFLRQRELDEYNRLMEQANAAADAGDDSQALALAWQAIAIGIKGWRNFTDPETGQALAFDADNVGRVLTVREFWELAVRYPATVRLVGLDLKNSGSPSCPATAGFAVTAAAAAT